MAALTSHFLLLTWALLLFMSVDSSEQASLLRDDFYKDSCPNAESVIKAAVDAELDKNLKLAAGLIRMQFHDCFVEGCDASVLLDGNDTEKTAPINSNLIGYEVVDAAKEAVEAVCPGVVSCSDILAYAARDSTVKLNGTGWTVQGGRKDGFFSCAKAAELELPPPTFNVAQLIESFARRGLSKKQMVILSGSHSVGVGHCDKFVERLYNFSETHFTDPSINASYAEQLKKECPQATFNTTLEIFMDTITPGEFDSNYYKGLAEHKGLFTSDQSLFDDRRTRKLVKKLMSERVFDRQFGEAMRAMGAVGVRAEGQIRRNCRTVNPW
ncbi:peroxidase [Marchantia polymorpha subsp. ruderalis]|uniref:Peroxidase n=1 Tax=Marchantia polymorpha TaxID=3197 RepID=A0A2R6W8S4_MARPO|nr:hypothetical protein MARPO_0128s0034 [Marchantia polymorpha]BBN02909.1 hypothetical protein Mp_2g19200 [Marchantia polymorpha subsp. ruderalis]|eukprot:PTQ30212.1 hypothetical protein MARPO_0128s0034 [Marchantia polymorpha]